jgi:ABC-2 type transport system ATP-binding protein
VAGPPVPRPGCIVSAVPPVVAPTSAPAVSVRDLWKRFDDKVAVAGIAFDVPQGCFFGLVGPNGAGKTTTIRMMTALLRPDVGQVWIGGRDVWADPPAAKARIGVLPDDFRLYERLTGEELLTYSGLLRSMAPDVVAERVAELLEVFELDAASSTLVIDYSTGMRKKVALAAALIHGPEVLFLDEPFEAVDPVSTRTLRGVLERYTDAGHTVVFSSHVMEVVERVCDRIAVVHQGRIVAEGATDDLRGGRRLEDVFIDLIGGRDLGTGALGWLGASGAHPPDVADGRPERPVDLGPLPARPWTSPPTEPPP